MNSIGHTDDSGTARYNKLLSVLRAEAVKTYLYNRGIDFKRITAYGMGEEQPIAENLANYHIFYGDASLINTEIDKYLSVNKEDILNVANKYYNKNNRVTLYYLPKENN